MTPGDMDEDEEESDGFEDGSSEYNVEIIADFDDHRKDVWRVKWNATGTILISAGDDEKLRLWKATLNGEFKCMSAVSSRQGEYVSTQNVIVSCIIANMRNSDGDDDEI